MKKLFFLILICSSMYGQVIQRVRDPDSDTVWYKGIYLQSPDYTAPTRLSSSTDAVFYIYQAISPNQSNGSAFVLFVGMANPEMDFQPSDTSKVFGLKMPPIWASYSASIAARLLPINGVIPTFATTSVKTSNYTATHQDAVILMSSVSAVDTVTLPLATGFWGSGISGQTFTIKKTDASSNAVRIKPQASNYIDSAAVYNLSAQNKYVTIVSNGGTLWYVIANN